MQGRCGECFGVLIEAEAGGKLVHVRKSAKAHKVVPFPSAWQLLSTPGTEALPGFDRVRAVPVLADVPADRTLVEVCAGQIVAWAFVVGDRPRPRAGGSWWKA